MRTLQHVRFAACAVAALAASTTGLSASAHAAVWNAQDRSPATASGPAHQPRPGASPRACGQQNCGGSHATSRPGYRGAPGSRRPCAAPGTRSGSYSCPAASRGRRRRSSHSSRSGTARRGRARSSPMPGCWSGATATELRAGKRNGCRSSAGSRSTCERSTRTRRSRPRASCAGSRSARSRTCTPITTLQRRAHRAGGGEQPRDAPRRSPRSSAFWP